MKMTFTKAVVLSLAAAVATPAMADLVVPNLSYRTGAFAAGGIPLCGWFQ